ncbi:baseplate assembly protein [Xanthomonas campestris]|uniref:baseplate assembly protein n=1 Tax=Xanthomonas campestris TaxID=339 RepID=UPI001C86091E|nr:baseplate J/gp47 family protein [Xanthomonas campestris]MCC5052013.1 baseplate J/gp47 family protein [Xanthomonas campestris pv. aberrans]MDM7683128.1 baseplate J/gp47 family protein [Xanthomonas campestris pv. campestris]MDM7710494.1 baseplate J/gp47 family protein [Xanthomonas campestris pv. campestris]MDO0858509.1 baseplate J/gp47 family protein [Xanthomonas campestris pv. campestris]MEA9472447.1 baseplate J/gp47 family protein [Xanthomonas campestris]
MASFTAVDLSKLQAPDLIEALDFEVIFDQALVQFHRLLPEFSALTEADPVYKLLQLFAARELLIRQRANDKAQQTMLAFATGTNLDHLGALFGVARLVLDLGQPQNGVAPTYESDVDFRRRIQLAPEGFSVAGPEGAYIYHALSAAADVMDASATSPAPGQVLVTVQSRTGNGTAPQALLDEVSAILTNDDVRPLTDSVTVQSAQIVPYAIRGRVYTYAGPDSAVVMREAMRSLQAYLDEAHRIGRDVPESAIKAKLFADGVQRVELDSPAADIRISRTQAAYCTAIDISHAGIDE